MDVEKDAFEDYLYMGMSPYDDGKPLDVRLVIFYTDRLGKQTGREVQVEKFIADDKDGMIYGHCFLRGHHRQFRISRITSCINKETGEHIENIPLWLEAKYRETDDFKVVSFLEEHDPAISVLNHIARADDFMRKAEKVALKKFCFDCGVHCIEVINLIVDRIAKNYSKESAVAYGKYLKELATKDTDYKLLVYKTAKYMIDSDRTKRDSEINALDRLIKLTGIRDFLDKSERSPKKQAAK